MRCQNRNLGEVLMSIEIPGTTTTGISEQPKSVEMDAELQTSEHALSWKNVRE